mgnify:CR=1 FL=1
MVSLLFYLKKSRPDREGRAMIYLRITVNGKRAELSTGRQTYPYKWNASTCLLYTSDAADDVSTV